MDKKRRLFQEEMDLNFPNNTGKQSFSVSHQDNSLTEPEKVTEKPSMYEVVILNDDFTPMDYVVFVLTRFFHMSREQASELTDHVHTHGQGVCGTYTREVAETKIMNVIELSRKNNHPLKCVMRKKRG